MDERSNPVSDPNGNNGNNNKEKEQISEEEDLDFGDDIIENDKSGKKAVSFDELEEQNKQLIAELEKKKSELDQMSDKMTRAQADFENYKKRFTKERKDYEFYVKQRAFRSILDVVDDFNRAIVSIETTFVRESTVAQSEILKGVKLIHERLENLLSNENIKSMETVGKDFDPLKHDVLFIEEKEEYEDNKIMEEFQKGYMLGSKVLRAAKVKVSKKRRKIKEKNDKIEETATNGEENKSES